MANFQQEGIGVSVKDANNGSAKLISFYGLRGLDIEAILSRLVLPGSANAFPKPNPSKNILKVWKKGTALFIMVDNNKISDFMDTGMKSVVSALIKSGRYDTEEVMHLPDVVDFKANTISKDEMDKMYKDAKDSEIDMWTRYLNTMNDPETRRILELYSKIYGNTSYGHMLSLTNVMTIKNINPDATFVLGQSSWAKFDRGVKRGAKPYPLWGGKPVKDATQEDIDRAQKELGHELEDFSDLGVAVKDAIMKKASQEASDNKWIPYRYIGYDIADTYRIHPNNDDPMKSKPGIISNITRELNALAAEVESKKNQKMESDEDMAKHNDMIQRTEKAVDEMEKICAESNVKLPNANEGVSMRLANMLIDYYSTRVTERANILRDGNVRQYAEDGAQLTMIMDGIGLDALNRFHHSLVYTQAEAAALARILKGTVSRLGRAASKQMTEGVETDLDLTKDSFLQKMRGAMKQLGIKIVKGDNSNNAEQSKNQETVPSNEAPIEQANDAEENNITPEQVKESFYSMLNRINSVVF